MAAPADRTSTIRSPLRSSETLKMMEACRVIGAEITHDENEIQVVGTGIGEQMSLVPTGPNIRYVWAGGSAFVGRLFAAICSLIPERVVIDGNNVLRNRPFAPLLSALRAKGAEFGFFDGVDSPPSIALSSELPGGRYQMETSVSSQFATALMVAAPLADAPTTIELIGRLYSPSYIRQTAAMMRHFGVDVSISSDDREILISQGPVGSYLMGAAFASRGTPCRAE